MDDRNSVMESAIDGNGNRSIRVGGRGDRPSRLLKRIEFSQVRAIEFPIVDGTTDRIPQ